MKLFQVHNRYREPGGEDVVVDAEAEVLRAGGHEILQFQVDNPRGAVSTAGVLSLASWNPMAARRVAQSAQQFRPDIAHVHNTWYSLSPSVLSALRRLQIPVVVTFHNYRLMCINGQLLRGGQICELCVGSHLLQGIRYRCYRGSALASVLAATATSLNRALHTWEKNVDLFLVMTEFAKDRFIAAGLPAKKVRVKPHFVADPGPRICAPSSSRTFLYVGRLTPEKGLHVLLDAWERAQLADFQLCLIGDGPLRADLERRRLRGVKCMGWVSRTEVRREMLSARALVFPSVWYETFGLSVIEAMACGLPVLASDLGGTAEILGKEWEWLISPGDAGIWARRLVDASRAGSLDHVGRQLHQRYLAQYSRERGLKHLEATYAEVIEAG